MSNDFSRSKIQELSLGELLSYRTLKAMHRAEREGYSDNLSLRVHRALSWLQRAEQEPDDGDSRFLFLWIAFNAAYAREFNGRRGFTERRLLIRYLGDLIRIDDRNLIYDAVWSSYPDSIRIFLDNEFVFQPFWDFQAGRLEESDWQRQFSRSKSAVNKALGRQRTRKVLAILFDRLYTLRNQIVHGGSTWNSGVNRGQVNEGARILGLFVPLMIFLMMYRPDQDWGEPCYPVIK